MGCGRRNACLHYQGEPVPVEYLGLKMASRCLLTLFSFVRYRFKDNFGECRSQGVVARVLSLRTRRKGSDKVSEVFKLAQSLVSIESTTGNEGACGEFLYGYLAGLNLQVERIPVTPDRFDVFAYCGNPDVVLSTHFDTVPPYLPFHEDEDFLYGRGSCDAKGILAAQVGAAQHLRAEEVGNFGMLFLVGEETISDGANAANEVPRGSKFMINGEPTENKLILGSKGNLRLDVRAHGKMAHSAYPHLGESAIDKLLDCLIDLRKMPLPTDAVLGASTLNIGTIKGGRAANVVPDLASAEIVIRMVNHSDETCRRIAEILKGRADYVFVRNTPALLMEKLEGYETDVVAFTTDLPSLSRWGRPLLLGPGSISVAHTERECIAKKDLLAAVDLYCRMVKDLKSRGAN
jgi:acetylornithine deacetylase